MGKVPQIRLALQACFDANKEPLSSGQIVAWILTHYSEADLGQNLIRTQLYRSCLNVGHTRKTTAPQIVWYEKSNKTYRLASPTEALSLVSAAEESEDTEFSADKTFVIEAHLRDYLAKNLGILESGLQLWTDNPRSVEYDVNGKRIDILARDVSGTPVIIELKLSRGHERTIGQALYYRGQLRAQLGASRIRIIMVAGEITEELQVASREVSDVTLYTYALTMQVNKL